LALGLTHHPLHSRFIATAVPTARKTPTSIPLGAGTGRACWCCCRHPQIQQGPLKKAGAGLPIEASEFKKSMSKIIYKLHIVLSVFFITSLDLSLHGDFKNTQKYLAKKSPKISHKNAFSAP
jgi:hypothetical protein